MKKKKISENKPIITQPCPRCNKEIPSSKLKEHISTSHITEILDGIFIGSYLNASDKNELERNNIKYIVNCAEECKNLYESDEKFKYLKLPLKDKCDSDIKKHFEDTYDFITNSLNAKDGNILIHCFKGKSRSSSIAIAYLVKRDKINVNNAYKLVKFKKKDIMPNLGFMSQLREYEKMYYKEE